MLIACSDSMTDERLNYVGEWQGNEMSLLIVADGTISYQRSTDGTTISIDSPIKTFEGDNFVVGLFFMTTTFVVTEPPHEVDGAWKMTVDQVRLTRVNE